MSTVSDQENLLTPENLEERFAELELVEAAYGDCFRLLYIPVKRDISIPGIAGFQHHEQQRQPTEEQQIGMDDNDEEDNIIFTISLDSGEVESNVVLEFVLPHGFPYAAPLRCSIHASSLSNSQRHFVRERLLATQGEKDITGGQEYMRVMDICQMVAEWIEESLTVVAPAVSPNCLKASEVTGLSHKTDSTCLAGPGVTVTIARFLIYFHHIMSSTKKKAILDAAKNLELGGFSKVGFPRVVVVEGEVSHVLEFVRQIQRLRWQQMVVRGEEIEKISPPQDATASGDDNGELEVQPSQVGFRMTYHSTPMMRAQMIRNNRKLPLDFIQVESDGGMSEVGAYCKQYGIHELFMTAMKKY